MEDSPPLEVGGHWAGQQICRLLWNRKDHYRFQNN
jgi:hypothetical protein